MDKIKGVEIDPVREKLIEAVGSFKFPIESCGCTIGEYIVPYSIQEPLVDHLIASGVVVSIFETTTDKDRNVPSKWIPVTERLPRYNEEVLVYRPKMAMKIYVSSYEGYYGEDDDEWHEGWGICGDITHWMPLPEPPKGE